MSLFQWGKFISAAGNRLSFKTECDELDPGSVDTFVQLVSRNLTFKAVHGVPTGGDQLAASLQKHCVSDGPTLFVDDVWTTGGSMRREIALLGIEGPVMGAVIFARGEYPDWVFPMWQAGELIRQEDEER